MFGAHTCSEMRTLDLLIFLSNTDFFLFNINMILIVLKLRASKKRFLRIEL